MYPSLKWQDNYFDFTVTNKKRKHKFFVYKKSTIAENIIHHSLEQKASGTKYLVNKMEKYRTPQESKQKEKNKFERNITEWQLLP